jgi:hypothetical protein
LNGFSSGLPESLSAEASGFDAFELDADSVALAAFDCRSGVVCPNAMSSVPSASKTRTNGHHPIESFDDLLPTNVR